MGKTRTFKGGATRDTDEGKLDIEAFISPIVTQRYCEYMHSNRKQSDGSLRDGDNWQKGIPIPAYMKSLTRHIEDVKLANRGYDISSDLETSICASIFNLQGYLFELLKARNYMKTNDTS